MPHGDHPPRRFDFGRTAVVQQPFTYNGRDYTTGEVFPYQELGLERYQMQGFWLGSYVDFPDVVPQPQVKPSKRAAAR